MLSFLVLSVLFLFVIRLFMIVNLFCRYGLGLIYNLRHIMYKSNVRRHKALEVRIPAKINTDS